MQNIPVLTVCGRTLAESYEKALIALHEQGIPFRTQYDKPEDPPSLDGTLNLTVLEPLADPMIHKAFPGGIEDLCEYVMEVQGAKDHWVKDLNVPSDTRWEYTYHGRLQQYGQWRERRDGQSVWAGPVPVDQIRQVIAKLANEPYTRQAQMITWMPGLDLDCYDPPCLQSLWYRVVEDAEGVGWLNCNVRFRSNDAWGAHFMNLFGFTLFNRDVIAAGIEAQRGQTIRLGRLNWQADSFHIYGKDLACARQRLFERLSATRFEDRVYHFHDPDIQEIYREAEPAIREKIRAFDDRQGVSARPPC